jgi:NAD(P)-dependent dehydrogenase (short-subunit alcohol dehydrogenase family)
MKLQNKVALVTGAGSGIGFETAMGMAQCGASVVVCDIQKQNGEEAVSQISKYSENSMFIPADVSDSEQVRTMMGQIIKKYGRLDIVVNNAGIANALGGVAEFNETDWDTAMAVNLKGVYLCSKYAIPELIANGGGSIINIASIGAIVGGGPPMVGPNCAYSASKGGVTALTRSIAYSYGCNGIRANSILPGIILTPMVEPLLTVEEFKKTVLDYTPLHRFGLPKDVANLAVFLASDDSSFITGADIIIDGGFTISQGKTFPTFSF